MLRRKFYLGRRLVEYFRIFFCPETRKTVRKVEFWRDPAVDKKCSQVKGKKTVANLSGCVPKNRGRHFDRRCVCKRK